MDLDLARQIKSLKGKLTHSEIRREIRKLFRCKKTKSQTIFYRIFPELRPDQCGLKELPAKNEVIERPEAHNPKTTYAGETAVAECVDPQIKTLDALLEACDVDLEVWEVEKYVINKWAVARSNKTPNITWVDGVPEGNVKDDGKMTVQELFQVKAFLKRRTAEINAKKILQEFELKVMQYAPDFKDVDYLHNDCADNLLEIDVPDLHLAKLCWGAETGDRDYDIKIAADDYKKAVRDLYSRARGRIKRVLLPVGNDMFNSDNLNGTTTKGTPQATSEDTRWPKTFMTGFHILVDMITELSNEVHVDVVIVPGNHDNERCFYLGACLQAWFRMHPNVTVDNAPTQRKYYRYGNTQIGFTHGSEEKPDKLPMIMASEDKGNWCEAKFHQWHLGHLHHEITRDIQGVVVRYLTSLAPPDEWHSCRGYIGSVQAAQAFEYHPVDGLVSVYYHNV